MESVTQAEGVLAGLLIDLPRLEQYELADSMFEGRARRVFQSLSSLWEERRVEKLGPADIVELSEKAGGDGILAYITELIGPWAPVNEALFRDVYTRFRARQIKGRLLRKVEALAKLPSGIELDIDEIRADIDELDRISEATGSRLAERASGDVKVRAIPWLFPGVLATHMATGITGDAGNGKTLVAVDMSARVTVGKAFPLYGKPGAPVKGHVFYVTSEGVPEMILVPRLIAAGADLSKITIIEGMYLRKGEFSMFDVTQHLPKLEKRARDFPDLKLIVLDPIASFLPERINPNQANSVRQAMDRVSNLAYKLGIAAVTVMHFAKASAGVKAIHRTAGSGQFEAALKMSWSVIRREGDARNARLLVPQKSNITGGYKSLSFGIHQVEFPAPDNPEEVITTAKIEYGDLVDEDPETLISPSQESDNHVAKATEFLSKKLKEGTTLYAARLIDEAEDQGIPKWALYKAKDRIGIEHDKEGHFQGRTFWYLPKRKD